MLLFSAMRRNERENKGRRKGVGRLCGFSCAFINCVRVKHTACHMVIKHYLADNCAWETSCLCKGSFSWSHINRSSDLARPLYTSRTAHTLLSRLLGLATSYLEKHFNRPPVHLIKIVSYFYCLQFDAVLSSFSTSRNLFQFSWRHVLHITIVVRVFFPFRDYNFSFSYHGMKNWHLQFSLNILSCLKIYR